MNEADSDRQGRVLYYATDRATAEVIVRDLEMTPKVDRDASLPGREVHKVYLATSPRIRSVIPHADTLIEVEVPTDAILSEGEGNDPEKGWRELVWQAPNADARLALSGAQIL